MEWEYIAVVSLMLIWGILGFALGVTHKRRREKEENFDPGDDPDNYASVTNAGWFDMPRSLLEGSLGPPGEGTPEGGEGDTGHPTSTWEGYPG